MAPARWKVAGKVLNKGWLLPLLLFATSLFAAPGPPSQSKISVHLLNSYSPGAAQIIQARPRVIKILGTHSAMLKAARDFKASTPDGKVVCRIYTSQRWRVTDAPSSAATDFWNTVLAPALVNLSPADKALIDYVEGPNEGDSTPTWGSLTDAEWYNAFWLQLAQLIAGAGFRPLAYSISVGNPPGSASEIQATLDRIVPSLRLCQNLGGGWSYHAYSLPYSTNLTDEIWYSVRYRQYYSYFASRYPDLINLPLVLTEGGIDGTGPWSTRGDTNKFQNWLAWLDSEIRRDDYCLGITLFQIGNTTDWAGFNVEPVAGWIARHLTSNPGVITPPQLAYALLNSPSNLTATFTRAANAPSAGNPANYFLRRADNGDQVVIASAALSGGSNVLLRTSALVPYTDYVLTVSNVGSSFASGATPGLNGTTNVLTSLRLAGIDEITEWRYEDSGANLGVVWRTLAYNDSTWPAGPPLLGYESDPLPEPLRTTVAHQTGKVTYYFRTRVHWPLTNRTALLRIRQVIDDGVVLYLNGPEIHRTGIATYPVAHTNLASRVVPDANYEGPFIVPVANLVLGTNVFAAEVHQQSDTSSDIVFGVNIEALVTPSSLAAARPRLQLRPDPVAGWYALSWSNSAFFLESAPTPGGPWARMASQNSPHALQSTGSSRYFRLVQ